MSFELDMLAAVRSIRDGFRGTAEIAINPQSCTLASTGAPLAVFADGASATPGVQVTDSETWGVRWNNHATPTAIATNVHIPRDFDPSYPATIYFDVSKTGATVGDATTITVGAYLTKEGQLHDADANFGGASGAVVGNLTAKTKSTLSRTFAASDLAAALGTTGPGTLAVSFGPTAGTLGTDDFVVHAAWIEYTRKAPAA